MGVRDLFFSIKARDETGAAFDNVRRNLRSTEGLAATTSDRLARMGRGLFAFGAATTAATAPIIYAFRDSLSLYDQQERAEAKVAQAVKSTAQAAGFSADELFRHASALQSVTRFGDEDILNGVTAQLLTFTNIAGDQFLMAQERALDLSTVLDGDLQSASIMLGKALNDPVKGLSAMSRAGITFSEDQAEVIKALAETGDMAAAQTLILEELEKQYGGQARAAAEAGMGAMDQLSNTWGDLKEEVGGVIAEILPPVVDFFKTIIDGFVGLPDPVKRGGVALFGAAAAFGVLATAAGIAAIALAPISTPFLLIGAAVAGATALVTAFWPEIKNLAILGGQALLNFGADVADGMQTGMDAIVGFANGAVNTFEGAGAAIKTIWGTLPEAIGDMAYTAANNLIGGVESMLNAVISRVNTFISGLNGALALLPEWATGEGGVTIGLVPEVDVGRLENEFAGAATTAAKGAKDAFAEAFQDSPLEAPDLGLAEIAEGARAAAALGEVPTAAEDVADSAALLSDAIPEVAGVLDDPGGGTTGGSLGSSARGAAGGVGDLGDSLDLLNDKAENTKGVFADFGQETADHLRDLFADGKLTMDDFGDFAMDWANSVLNRMLTSFFDPLGDALQGVFDGMFSGTSAGGGLFGGIVSGIGSMFGGLLGLDTGGEMEVGGRAGIDRNVAAFKVSADENIKVVKRGNPDGGRAVNVYIQTPDPAAFHASKGRIASDLARAVGHGARFT